MFIILCLPQIEASRYNNHSFRAHNIFVRYLHVPSAVLMTNNRHRKTAQKQNFSSFKTTYYY